MRYFAPGLVFALTIPAIAAAQDVGTVSIFHRWAGEQDRREINAAFDVCRERLPGLVIEESFVPHDQYEVQLPVQLSSGNPPDIYGLWPGGRALFQAQAGNILDISEAWEESIGGHFAEGMTASVTEADGNIYVVPFDTIPNTFFYSTAAFEEAGVEPPETWEEFMAAAAAIAETGSIPLAIGALNGWEPLFWFDYLLLRTAGSDFRERLMAGEESYTSPEVVEAMTLWQEMLEAGYFEVQLSGAWDDMAQSVIAGDTAMLLMGPWAMNAFLQAGMTPNEDFGFFPFPVIDPAVPIATEGAFQGWAASGKGQNTEGAVRLLDCLASAEAQEAQSQGNTNLAANPDVPIEAYDENLRPVLTEMRELLQYQFHQNLELATLPPVTEVAKREFARFLARPGDMERVLEAIEQRARETFGG